MFRSLSAAAAVAAAFCSVAAPAFAQQQPPDLPMATVCGQQARPAAQPPAGTAPVVLFIAPCFEAQGNASVIEPQTYLYYIQQKASVPSRGVWVPYDDTAALGLSVEQWVAPPTAPTRVVAVGTA